jgi:hypothetical protein
VISFPQGFPPKPFTRLFPPPYALHLILYFNIFPTYSWFSKTVAFVHLFLLKRILSSFLPRTLSVPPLNPSEKLFACSICFHKHRMQNNTSKKRFIHFHHILFYFIFVKHAAVNQRAYACCILLISHGFDWLHV